MAGANARRLRQTQNVDITDDELLAIIRQWLPGRRWYAGKGHLITQMRMSARHGILGARQGQHLVVAVQTDGKRWQVYQIPVVVLDTMDPATFIGSVGRQHVHDGTAYEVVLAGMLGQVSEVPHLVPVEEQPHTQWLQRPPSLNGYRVLRVEQSNTSMVVGGSLVKMFRMLSPGVNPDIEVHEGLSRVGCRDVGRLQGWINSSWTDPESKVRVHGHLAMIQEFFADSTDGWNLALQCVAGGQDFSVQAHALGQATARVHRSLAEGFQVAELDHPQIRLMTDRLHRRLTFAAETVSEIRPMAEELHGHLDQVAQLSHMTVQRVHGDYHLAQTLSTPRGWRILDFEGEPGGDFENRRILDHPLRDVAGMIRSFAYAAWQGGGDTPAARAWQQDCERGFLAGYAISGADPAQNEILLQAYLLDKAAYEAVYEKRNRPGWVGIPLRALAALADS